MQPGWQVVVSAGMLARPLVECVSRLLGRRGAYAVQRLSLAGTGINVPWAQEAPDELLGNPASIETHPFHEADAWIGGYRAFWEEKFDSFDAYLRKERR